MATKKRRNWGGVRPGAGRPKGTGNGSSPASRRNRIALMLTDAELEQLGALARQEGRPLATLAYECLRAGLRNRARRAGRGAAKKPSDKSSS